MLEALNHLVTLQERVFLEKSAERFYPLLSALSSHYLLSSILVETYGKDAIESGESLGERWVIAPLFVQATNGCSARLESISKPR